MFSFDSQEIIKQFQSGKWYDNSAYWAVYRSSWRRQKGSIKQAERMRAGIVDEGNPHTRPPAPASPAPLSQQPVSPGPEPVDGDLDGISDAEMKEALEYAKKLRAQKQGPKSP